MADLEDVADLPEHLRPTPPPAWSDVQEKFGQTFPDLNPEVVQQAYEQRRQEVFKQAAQQSRLQQARDDLVDKEETTGSFIRRKKLPFISPVVSFNAAREYSAASKRLAGGEPLPHDYGTIAGYEKTQQEDEQRHSTLGGTLLNTATSLPAMAAEAVTGGYALRGLGLAGVLAGRGAAGAAAQTAKVAVPRFIGGAMAQTALMPAIYMESWAHNNLAAHRDPLHPAGLPAAFAMGTLQTAVLGSLGPVGSRLTPELLSKSIVGRLGIKTGVGLVEQQVADTVGGALGLHAGYGTLGELLQGKFGEAGRNAAGQALTFAVFGAMHGNPEGQLQKAQAALEPHLGAVGLPASKNVLRAMAELMSGSKKAGLTPEAGFEQVGRVSQAVGELLRDNPNPTRAEAKQVLGEQFPAGSHAHGAAQAWADSLPEKRPLRSAQRAAAEQQLPPLREPEPGQGSLRPASQEAGAPQLPPLSQDQGQAPAPLRQTGTGEATAAPPQPERAPLLPPLEEAAARPRRRGTRGQPPEPPAPPPAPPGGAGPEPPGPGPQAPLGPPRPGEPPAFRGGPQGQPAAGSGKKGEAGKKPAEAPPSAEGLHYPPTREELGKEIERLSRPVEKGEERPPSTLAETAAEVGKSKLELHNEVRKLMGLPPLTEEPAAKTQEKPAEPQVSHGDSPGQGKKPLTPEEQALTHKELQAGGSKLLARSGHIDMSDLPPRLEASLEKHADSIPEEDMFGLKAVLQTGSYRAAMALTGVSHETSGNRARRALEQLKKLDPETWGQVEVTAEGLKQNKDTREAENERVDVVNERSQKQARNAELASRGQADKLDAALDAGDHETAYQSLQELTEEQQRSIVEDEAFHQKLLEETNRVREESKQAGLGEQAFEEKLAAAIRQVKQQRAAAENPGAGQAAGAGGEPAGEVPPAKPQRSWKDFVKSRKQAQPGPAGPLSEQRLDHPDVDMGQRQGQLQQLAEEAIRQVPELQEKISSEGPTPATEIARGSVGKAVADFLSGEEGHLDLDRVGEVARNVWERIKSATRHARDSLAELAGQMGPRTTRLDRETGETLARHNAVPVLVKEAVPDMIDRVLGDKPTPEADRRLGAAATEMHLRQTRQGWQQKARQLQQQGDAEGARQAQWHADHVVSEIGPGKDIADEAAYQQIVAAPEFQQMRANWKEHMAPVMETNYRKAQGLEDGDDIHSFTQVPDFPMNLKPRAEGEGQAAEAQPPAGTGQGNLKGTHQGTLLFARERKGNAPGGYDTSLSAIIENSLRHGFTRAAKAELFRVAQANGVGMFGAPGQRLKMGDDELTEIPHVFPKKGTQFVPGEEGGQSFYVKSEAYPEWRAAFKVDQPVNSASYKAFAAALTRASLASTVEFAYHSKNLLTFLFKPGVRVSEFLEDTIGVVRGDREVRARLVELARTARLKGAGMESGLLLPEKYKRYDPTYWAGAGLDVLQRGMRLAADRAFTRLAEKGLVEDTETNRRDFTNQLGQYIPQAQHQVVRLFRDTGVGPFATAGSNYWMQGLKTLALGHGLQATSLKADLALRAGVGARILGTVGAVLAANYALHQRVDGDDKTPLGAIKLASRDGKSVYFDLTNLTGLTRGMRQTGMLALLEGERRDQASGGKIDRAVESVIHGLVHPGVGPSAAFLWTAATGRNTLGRQVADKPDVGGSQAAQNALAAVRSANPTVATLGGWDNPNRKEEPSTLATAGRLLGPFGLRESSALAPATRTYYERMKDLEEHRRDSPEFRAGKRFPHEQEYQRLHAYKAQLDDIAMRLRGEYKQDGRTRQGSKPSEETAQKLRQIQESLASKALAK